MAALISSSFFLTYFLLSLCLAWSLDGKATTAAKSHKTHQTHHTLQLSSLLPATICTPATKEDNYNEGLLKVVHKNGPCARLHQQDQATGSPTDDQLLEQDQSRVDSIHYRLSNKLSPHNVQQTDGTTLPAKSGSVVGSGNYIVTVGLGTPKRDLSLIFDTGSDLTWTQCQPCARSCYSQKETIFDPSKSSSYANVSCTSSSCSDLTSATGNTPGCASGSSTCLYGIQYGDQSFSVGYFSKERITLTRSDVFDGFLFGCGQNNRGLFGGAAGLLGLGRNKISFVQQTAQKYNRVFSYCLPSVSSATGYLSFGSGGKVSSSLKYTPLSTISLGDSFYALNLVGISVAGTKLSIPPSVFTSSGTIIDSGTVISRLPATAYSALRSAFRQQMTGYPSAAAVSILDTCYDLSSYSSARIPKISFFFGGGTVVELDPQGILYVVRSTQVCLAFAGNSDDSSVTIFGNTQQKRLQVVYDIGGGRIGFGPASCS
ncbi:aspartyl protease family protein At5g10770 [Ziziphus jujuba]|uniref:Aspartyl protease family protein At5g10770 n=2 Tax=Ziziphus jujuba TaxID=326968 RepID=A0A6P3ZW74_ZIZJJ|nr:aspartyl protease family protein At5g10770 [Ziziphus jujuba]KAH7523925.1 hypothetical protein FEM48_Zijuj06G0063800 [Ziziphus jujuba var. spinosa]